MPPESQPSVFALPSSLRRWRRTRKSRASLVWLTALWVLVAPPTGAQTLTERINAEIVRSTKVLDALPDSGLAKSETPAMKERLDQAESLLKTGHVAAALESLSSTLPGVTALARASTGWEDDGGGKGKGTEALTREWEEVGRALRADRPRFPEAPPEEESAFVRALAEQSVGQIDEQYTVAVDYGRFSGASAGAYYLGRAEGQMALALFLSGLPRDSQSGGARKALALPPLRAPLAALEDDIVTAYARPGSTKQHTNFIIANSSLKLARELDQKGFRLGALITMLRSRQALGMAVLGAPDVEQQKALSVTLDGFARELAASSQDQSIGEALIEKAHLALEKSQAGGEGAETEARRAAALVNEVLPRYLEIVGLQSVPGGSKK